ncbi:MAG: hydroxymethylbilane synthase [Acidobacteriota bacterium]|nr:hydroxymethylbilane synthase [Acidobacteriota bacterium]MDQ5873260.1 hydroxymethylbilane synthase [Acidobacteriota bacterium]
MKVRIGGRGSPLSRAQLDIVAAALRHRADVEIVAITTTGDRLSRGESAMTGKDLFTREIDEALLEGRIDLAVHSLKDLPSRLPAGLAIVAVPEREDPSDVLVSRDRTTLGALPPGSRVGSSSPRRRAQLLAARPDLLVIDAQGNVDTRLRRLSEGRWDAIVLARAGLARLRRLAEVTEILPASVMLPAIGQGALAVVAREEAGEVRDLVASLDHSPSHREAAAERALLELLEAGCRAPVAGLARHVDGGLRLSAAAFALDGSAAIHAAADGEVGEPAALGREVARRLLDLGASALLALARAT